jgi:transforming growth factor-beta-induced protein
MKRSVHVFVFVFLILFLAACSGSDKPKVDAETVAGKIANNPELSSLTKALQDAGLFELLNDTRGSYTVFAPSNAAFAVYGALPQGDELTTLLYYHVVNDVFDETKLTAEAPMELETVEGKTLAVTVVDGKVVLNGQVNLTQADITASNGVVHVVDKVLSPAK